jgi:carboxymethylenebutenolidase
VKLWHRWLAAAFVLVAVAAGSIPDARAARADTSRVRLGTAETGTDAFVAWPEGDKPGPAIVLVHEWWGLNRQIREVARRFARNGYVTIVPDLYHGRVADDPERAHVLARGVDGATAVGELSAAVTWLRAQERTAKGSIGVVGFCMGGSLAQELAMANPQIAATVVFYGGPERDYVAKAAARAPLQGHFGADDDGIPLRGVESFRDALKAQGNGHEVYVYAGAGHAFMHEGRASHHADA